MSTVNVKMWIAMDLSDKENEFYQIDEFGNKVRSGKVKNHPNDIETFFREFDASVNLTVIIEAGTCSPWISRIIELCNHKVIVANPRKVRAIWDTVNKTDQRDAELLARLGRVDKQLLAPIKHRNLEEQIDLSVIRMRENLVQVRTKISNCVKGTLKSIGVMLEKSIKPMYLPQNLPLYIPPNILKLVDPLLMSISSINQQIKELDKKAKKLCNKYPECEQFMKIPGVGELTSLTFRLTISDPKRMMKTRDVGSYLGLIPKRDQSGTIDKKLGITKAGDTLCRTMLIRAATYILGPFGADSDLRRSGLKIKEKGGKAPGKRAATAIARKLAVALVSIWKSGETYRPFKNQKLEEAVSK